jgi:ElaB/YqjD/DUF883 family membrane-anchored ribosome-binding protein
MDTSTATDLSNEGHAFVDKTADTLQSGIREVKLGTNTAASSASRKVESTRTGAGQAIDSAADRAEGVLAQLSAATQKAKALAVETQDSIVTYTRENPVKSLLLAAAAGAILITIVRALTPSSKDS